jgi:hypothetical protein
MHHQKLEFRSHVQFLVYEMMQNKAWLPHNHLCNCIHLWNKWNLGLQIVQQVAHESSHKQHQVHHIKHDIYIHLVVLLVIPPPPLLNEIPLKIIVHTRISNVMVRIKKARDSVSTSMMATQIGTSSLICHIPHSCHAYLNVHVMHDYASIHDISKDLLILKSSRWSHNSKIGLQNPKYMFHVFLATAWALWNWSYFLPWRLWSGFTNITRFK